jgi:hypothetical protein
MPHSPESSYIRYRLPTGLLLFSLMLSCGLVGWGRATAAAEPEAAHSPVGRSASTSSPAPSVTANRATVAPSVDSSRAALPPRFSFNQGSPTAAGSLAPETPEVPLLAQVWPGYPVPTPVVPTLSQPPGSASPAPANIPIPWQVTPPIPVAQAEQPYGTPAQMPMGTWVMVWLPYGMPYPGAPGAAGSPVAGTPAPYGVAYPAWVPALPIAAGVNAPGTVGAWPTAVAPPMAYPAASTPWILPPGAAGAPLYPQQLHPQQAYGQLPGPVGYVPGSVAAPAFPQPGPVQLPFAAEAAVPLSQPLTVPAAPATGAGVAPPPPAQPIPVMPPVLQPATGLPGSVSPLAATSPILSPAPATLSPANPQPLELAAQAGANTTAGPLSPQESPAFNRTNVNVEGLYVLQGDRSSARARLNGSTFLTPNLLVGGTLDIVTGPDLTSNDGVQLTELYLAAAIPDAPGLRFRVGQLDLTSYFDRNSFAKDIGRDFFNPNFNTNPALIAGLNSTASHPGGLVQWAVNDDITLSASAFSSAPGISDFALDGFAGELSFRTGNLILRGTYLTSRDTEFQGTQERLSAYGINAEWFIPEANIGLFGRYGRLNNAGTGLATDTYSFGLNALDLFMDNDRLGLAYGRNLSTAVVGGLTPDALEVFYDFEVLPNIRLGFTFQQLNQFSESYAGFRIRSGLDLTPSLSLD